MMLKLDYNFIVSCFVFEASRPFLIEMFHVNSFTFLWKDKEKCEPENVVQEPVRLSWAPPQDVPVWDISNCFLQDGQILIPREEEVMDNRHIKQCQ